MPTKFYKNTFPAFASTQAYVEKILSGKLACQNQPLHAVLEKLEVDSFELQGDATLRHPGNYDAEYCRLKNAAESGEAEAQYQFALLIENIFDRKAPENRESFRWMKVAADAGHSAASYCLGNFYRDGTWVDENYRKAYECYLKAAKLGNSDGMERLGSFYANGIIVPVSQDMAFALYQLSAELGNPKGMCQLGLCYLAGAGCRQEIGLALYLISQAVETGHPAVIPLLRQIGLDVEKFSTGYKQYCQYQAIVENRRQIWQNEQLSRLVDHIVDSRQN